MSIQLVTHYAGVVNPQLNFKLVESKSPDGVACTVVLGALGTRNSSRVISINNHGTIMAGFDLIPIVRLPMQ